MCHVVIADLGRARGYFDPASFTVVLNANRTARQRSAAARRAMAIAGQPQDEAGVICVCGLQIDVAANFASHELRDVMLAGAATCGWVALLTVLWSLFG